MRFPALATKPLPVDGRECVDELANTMLDPRWHEGYVRIHAKAGNDQFLFVHAGKAHFAGAIEEDRFVSRSFLDFFQSFTFARSVEYCATDQALLLALAVPFRKAPSTQLAPGTVSSASLANAIEMSMKQTGGRDVVMSFRRGEAVSLALYRAGTTGWLYPAPLERFPDQGTPAERIIGYVTAFPDVSADVYDDVSLPAASGAGQPFRAYLEEATARALLPAGLVPSLAVYMGQRLVYRYVMDREEIKVGRGGDNDLALDNLTVSRSHAIIRHKMDGLLVIDLGGQNGVIHEGRKVKEVMLKPGDKVEIGKYTLLYDHYAPHTEARQNPVAPRKPSAEETIGIAAHGFRKGKFVHDGKEFPMTGMVFHIGKADDAHLRIGGLFVAPIHVRVIRDTTGTYKATHVAGNRAMNVNGKPEKEVVLKHGDELEIAGSVLRFELEAPTRSPKQIGP